jgi:hypothetical protein
MRNGHGEYNTVIGEAKYYCLLTLVEHKTGFAVVNKLSSSSMAELYEIAIVAISEHRGHVKAITFDNGMEFHDHQVLEQVHPSNAIRHPLPSLGAMLGSLKSEVQHPAMLNRSMDCGLSHFRGPLDKVSEGLNGAAPVQRLARPIVQKVSN